MQECTKPEQEDRGRTDALTELIRSGAQQLLAQALKAEVAELLAAMETSRMSRGMRGLGIVNLRQIGLIFSLGPIT